MWTRVVLALLLFLAPPALAQSAGLPEELLTPEALNALRDEAAGLVEKATGVALSPRPPVRRTTREKLAAVLRVEIAPQMKVALPDATEAQRAAQLELAVKQLGQFAMGKFVVAERAIMIAPENFAVAAKALKQPRILSRDWLRVVMIHELVHAVQQQQWQALSRFPQVEDTEALHVLNAVVEGHAQWVTRRVLTAEGNGALFDDFERSIVALPAGLDKATEIMARVQLAQLEFAYVDGRKFFDAVAAERGADGLAEAVFGKLPASRRQVLEPARYLKPTAVATKLDMAPVWKALVAEHVGWGQVRRPLDLPTLRGAMAPLKDPERVGKALRTVIGAEVLVLHRAGGRQQLIIATCQHADDAAATRFARLNEDLTRAKDAQMKTGAVTIESANYEDLGVEAAPGVYAVKVVVAGAQRITVRVAMARVGRFTFEVIWQGIEGDRAGAAKRVAALVDQVKAADEAARKAETAEAAK